MCFFVLFCFALTKSQYVGGLAPKTLLPGLVAAHSHPVKCDVDVKPLGKKVKGPRPQAGPENHSVEAAKMGHFTFLSSCRRGCFLVVSTRSSVFTLAQIQLV